MKNKTTMMIAAVAAMFAAGAAYSATHSYYAGGEGTETEPVNIASAVWTNATGAAVTPSGTTYNMQWPPYFSSEGPVYMTNTTAVGTFVCYDLNTVWKNAREEGYNAGEQDASIVATSMMFEAEDLGIHSIWLRGFNSKLVSEAFELPENIKPVMMLAIGYPSESSTPSPRHSDRKPLADTVEEL